MKPDPQPSNTISIPADALVILVGPSGAGKSTFAATHFRETEVVSSDRCRALVSDDEADQSATGPAFEVFQAIVRGRLGMGRLTVADATNLEAIPRQRLLALARQYGRPAVVIILDVPPDLARDQNLARARSVPTRVLDTHYERLAEARELLPSEGYDAVYRIRPGSPVLIVKTGPDV